MTDFHSIVIVTHALSSFFMLGLIWFVQIVHYPLFKEIAEDSFTNYEKLHCKLTGFVVGPAMIIEIITGFLLFYLESTLSRTLLILNLIFLLTIWLSTIFIQSRAHLKLAKSFDSNIHKNLVKLNWLRTILWSLRAVILGFLLFNLIN